MSTNQEAKHISIRTITSTTGTYNEDWIAAFDDDSVAAGTFNERMIGWLQNRLTSSNENLPDLQAEFAIDKGADSWDQLGAFTI